MAARHRDRVALVTGAAGGIGRATALRFAEDGALVVGLDRDAAGLDSLASEVRAGGREIESHTVDLADRAQAGAAVGDVLARHGRVDILANIAGVTDRMLPAHELDDSTWDQVIAVNLTAVAALARAVLPAMVEQGRGAILNMASVAALGGGSSGLAYTASKHGIVGITRSIAWMYGADGVRCNAVCPGRVATAMTQKDPRRSDWALERLRPFHELSPPAADPSEIAALMSWLSSGEGRNLNGSVITSDGGWTAA